MRTHRMSVIVLIALAAVVGGLYGWYRTDLAAAERSVASGSALLSTPFGPLEYADSGRGEAFLVLHGSGGGFDQGRLIAEQILPPEARVIAPSRFGYLRTPLPGNAGAGSQADAYAALLDALGVERAVVVAISAGTPSAVAFARAYPERTKALILVSPAIFSAERPAIEPTPGNRLLLGVVMHGSDFVFWLLKRVSYSTVVGFMGVDPALYHAAPAADRAEMDRIVDSVTPMHRRLAGMLNDGTVIEAARPYALDKLAMPALILCAHDDLLADCAEAERVGREAGGVELAILESGGHLLLGRWSEARAILRGFLNHAY